MLRAENASKIYDTPRMPPHWSRRKAADDARGAHNAASNAKAGNIIIVNFL